MFSSIFSKEENKTNLSTTSISVNELMDTSTHSSFDEVIVNNPSNVSEKENESEKVEGGISESDKLEISQMDLTLFKDEGDTNYEIENEMMYNPFLNLEEILLKLADKHNQLDEELNKIKNPNKILELKQCANAEIIKLVSSLPSHTHDSEGAVITAILLINDTLERILTVYHNKQYKYLNSFQKKTDNFSLNVYNNCVLNNLRASDKEMLNRLIENLILEGQSDYCERKQQPLFYTNSLDDRYFIKRDKIIVAILKILSHFVENLLALIPNLQFEEEMVVALTEQDKIDAQMEMIFEPIKEIVPTKRRSKRRG